MEQEEAQKVIEIIARWMELREQGGYDPLQDSRRFRLEAEHSLRGGLLQRLLVEDKEPLEHTPPLAFSRPWYGLIENGEAVIEKMFVYAGIEKDTMAICQHQWHVYGKDGEDFLLKWRPGKTGESHWGKWRLVKNIDCWTLRQDRTLEG